MPSNVFQFEIWKTYIEGYYEVSNLGNIRSIDRYVENRHGTMSLRRGRKLKLTLDTKGYLTAIVNIKGISKTIRLHRIVGEVFIINPKNKPQISHKDGRKTNNHFSNLEWSTLAESKANTSRIDSK